MASSKDAAAAGERREMAAPRRGDGSRRLGLRTRLLVPYLVVGLLGAAGLAALTGVAARGPADQWTGARRAAGPSQIADSLRERQRGGTRTVPASPSGTSGGLEVPFFIQDLLDQVDRALAAFPSYTAIKSLTRDGLALATGAARDLARASTRPGVVILLGVVALLALLVLPAVRLVRQVESGVRFITGAVNALAEGQYHHRVAAGPVRELNELGVAINQLAEHLDETMARLTRQASYDPLSDLPNRSYFTDRLERALSRTARRGQSVAVIFLDLDNFKVINDSLGHDAGDQLLVAVGRRLQGALRREDTLARFGGDEFTILLEDLTGAGEAVHVAERILRHLQSPFVLGAGEVFTTASMGIALNTPEHSSAEDLIRNADMAMYRAKMKGKARYEVFDHTMAARAVERLEMETDLRRATERGDFMVHYQPVVHLATGRITGVEALVRWKHPRSGLVAPDKFMALAEETGMIVSIGRWVLEYACHQWRAWQARHPGLDLVMSVNVSTRQFQQRNLAEDVARILRQTGVDPCHMCLEITESAMIVDEESAVVALRELKSLGVRVALDDFGTGYSALGYFTRLPLDSVKIDKTFVAGLGRSPRDTAIVHAVIRFAKTLNLTVTAEGIETPEQLVELRALECDQGQGYLFAKPLPGDAVYGLLAGTPSWGEPATRVG